MLASRKKVYVKPGNTQVGAKNNTLTRANASVTKFITETYKRLLTVCFTTATCICL